MSTPLKLTIYNTSREGFVLIKKDYLKELERHVHPQVIENFYNKNQTIEECKKGGRACASWSECCSGACLPAFGLAKNYCA